MKSSKQRFLQCSLFVIGLPLLGLLYQTITSMLDAHRYPPPGRLIDVGGHRLHLYSMGQQRQSPTVVLEAGLSCSHLDWCKVQPEVAKFARVCSYDRAGLGWSEAGPSTRSSSQMVTELHQLLTNANIPGPYILVAHSFGGFIVRLYANQYPQEVAGLVLVDTSHEDQLSLPFVGQGIKASSWAFAIASLLAPFGLTRLAIHLGLSHHYMAKYPPVIRPLLKVTWGKRQWPKTAYKELVLFKECADQVRTHQHAYAHLPLIVLSQRLPAKSSSRAEKQIAQRWQMLQQDLANQSSQGQKIRALHSGHYIQLDQPELVIDAIKSIFQATMARDRKC